MAGTVDASLRQSSIGVEIKIGELTLDNVSDIPDLGGAPEQIEVTAIGDKETKYIQGIKDVAALEFTCFYQPATYTSLQAMEAEGEAQTVEITLEDGSKVAFSGTVAVYILGFGVGDAITFNLTVTPTSDIEVTPAQGE